MARCAEHPRICSSIPRRNLSTQRARFRSSCTVAIMFAVAVESCSCTRMQNIDPPCTSGRCTYASPVILAALPRLQVRHARRFRGQMLRCSRAEQEPAPTRELGNTCPTTSYRAEHHYQTTQYSHQNSIAAAYSIGWLVSAGALLPLLLPDVAAAGETLPLEFVQQWLDQIESLGPWGAVAFVVTVSLAEMIPLFPTQPLSLAGGLLFGAGYGGALVLLGTSIAAVSAFTVSRTIGKDFAQRVINSEMGEAEEGKNSSMVKSQLQRVYTAIEHGDFVQQYAAIALLRLTPVVPFSAGNYLLGLTPLPYGPFIAGSLTGMTVWSFLYASIGGASRSMLRRGVGLETLFNDMAERAAGVTEQVAVGALVMGAAVAAAWSMGLIKTKPSPSEDAAVKEKVEDKYVKDRV